MDASVRLAVAALFACSVIALVVFGGLSFGAALQNSWLGAIDTEIERWSSRPVPPRAVVEWRNRTAAARCLRLDGRDVIVVGNAPTVHNMGNAIDAVDVVVRVNPAGERSVQHTAAHRGQRAHALHVNSNHPTSRLSAIFGRFGSSGCIWTRSRKQTAIQLGLPFADPRIQPYDSPAMISQHAELKGCGKASERFLTAGMLAVLHALSLGARKPVRLAGITAFVAQGHAYTENASRFHNQMLRRYHCVEVERALLRRLVREGAVSVVCEAAGLLGKRR